MVTKFQRRRPGTAGLRSFRVEAKEPIFRPRVKGAAGALEAANEVSRAADAAVTTVLISSMHLPRDRPELLIIVSERLLGLQEDRGDAQDHAGDRGLRSNRAGEDVVVTRVLEVELEALDRAQTTDGCLRGKPKEGNHGEAGVLHLLELLLGGRHAHRIERMHAERPRLPGLLPALDAHGLQHGHGRDQHGELRLGVQGVLLGTGSPPVAGSDQVGEQDARDGGHGPATVGELCLGVVREHFLVGSETKRVKAVVTGHGAIEMGRGSGTLRARSGRAVENARVRQAVSGNGEWEARI